MLIPLRQKSKIIMKQILNSITRKKIKKDIVEDNNTQTQEKRCTSFENNY